MDVIRKLGDRVEKEHDQYLRDSQRIEDRSSTATNGINTPTMGGSVDFESLVGGNGATVKADTVIDSSKSWDDDVWGSIFSNPEVSVTSDSPQGIAHLSTVLKAATSHAIAPPMSAAQQQQQHQSLSLPSSLRTASSAPNSPLNTRPSPATRSSRGLGATPVSPTSFHPSAFSPPPQSRPSLSTPARSSLSTAAPLTPQTLQRPVMQQSIAPAAPNYNISLPPAPVMHSTPMAPAISPTPAMSTMPSPPLFAANMGGVLAPSKAPPSSWSTNGTKQLSKDDWGDFDPLA